MKKIIIIGGVAIGATAAARLRRKSEEDHIIMFEKDEYISFANCGLPYYIGETITDRNKLIVQQVEGMSKRYNLDIRNNSEVISINREAKTVTVLNRKESKEYTESYDKLIIGTGSKPIKPPFEGMSEASNIMTLRNIPDTDAIKAMVDKSDVKNITVVGGGFIGVEVAENLVERGKNVTLVDLADQVLAPFDFEMAQILHTKLENKGVKLLLGQKMAGFANQGKIVKLESGIEIPSDLTVLAIGVSPESKLAVDAGLEVNERNAIKVNEYMQTSDENIFAGGDAIAVQHYLDSSKEVYIPLAWPANRQARLIADNVNGDKVKYPGTLGSSVLKVFELTAAATGASEKLLKMWNMKYEILHIHRGNHAGYYPGAANIAMKLIFNPENGQIYGAQAIGPNGTEKRIDVIATAIKGKLTVEDLIDLELTYAPPFNSAKDPVNIAGYVASNLMDGSTKQVQWNELDEKLSAGAVLIDVRTSAENEFGNIPGNINIDLDTLRDKLDTISQYKDKEVILHCAVGFRGYLAEQILRQNGFKNVANLAGGYTTYSSAKYQLKGMNLKK
jgi:NADPH-dependent 2,4-dienoyl-CoA reductase/sulfur reductase-like enzyme/rhodanese-related sulfurtransferase